MTPVKSKFSLADITDLDPFEQLGKRLAANPGEELRRMQVSAKIVTARMASGARLWSRPRRWTRSPRLQA